MLIQWRKPLRDVTVAARPVPALTNRSPVPDTAHALVRLHQNRGGYCGEQLRIETVHQEIRVVAEKKGWTLRELAQQGDHPVFRLWKSPVHPVRPSRRVYISAGIHGDEPAGTLAALRLMEQDGWPEDAEVVLFPCLNPTGIAGNRREGPEGRDFNRDYLHPETSLVRVHLDWLRGQQPFEVALLLHEDWEADGFYLYELRAPSSPSLARNILADVAGVCPILQAGHADGWPAEMGVVRPAANAVKRTEWPEALYLFQNKSDLCYTFEAPSDYDLSTRVSALVTAVSSALQMRASD